MCWKDLKDSGRKLVGRALPLLQTLHSPSNCSEQIKGKRTQHMDPKPTNCWKYKGELTPLLSGRAEPVSTRITHSHCCSTDVLEPEIRHFKTPGKLCAKSVASFHAGKGTPGRIQAPNSAVREEKRAQEFLSIQIIQSRRWGTTS